MIEIKNVSKKYDNPVLEDVSVKIEEGSIFGLVGINGAGKSTLLKLMCGILKPESGEILYDGVNVYENLDVKKDIFFLSDDPFYSRNTTPKTLPDLYNVFYNFDNETYYRFLDLYQIPVNKTMYTFSKGMRRQVFCALAFAIKPKYLFLDEAFDGLDPLARLMLKKEMIRIQNENNMTVVISSHSLRELEDICDCYGMLDGKKITTSGTMDDIGSKYFKYRMAFTENYDRDDFKDIPLISFKAEKRIVTIVSTMPEEEFKKSVEHLSPLIVDVLPIDFEEMFIIEVESRGYSR